VRASAALPHDAPVTSALDRWNPLTPLAAATALVLVAFAGPQPWTPAAVLALSLAIALASGIGGKVTVLTLLVVVPTFALLVLLDAAFPESAAETRWIPSRAATLDALAISLRLGAAIAALGVIVVGVAPRRLTRALAARGLPAWAAYLVIASLEAVPDARRRADDVLDAQRCRGVAVGKGTGVRGRLRALPALAGPLIVGLVIESEERALALDARAFDARGKRTALAPIADPVGEIWMRRVIWLALAAAIAWRLWEFAHSLVIAA
jgi:energy-coupling factor transport system permease protein